MTAAAGVPAVPPSDRDNYSGRRSIFVRLNVQFFPFGVVGLMGRHILKQRGETYSAGWQ